MAEHNLGWEDLDKTQLIATGARHTFRLPKQYDLHIRFDLNPKEGSALDDRFVLIMKWQGNTYHQVRTVADDQVAGDDYVDIVFCSCRPEAEYSLQWDPGREGDPYFVFESLAFAELFNE